jgi:hypothetical protein
MARKRIRLLASLANQEALTPEAGREVFTV